MIVTLKSTVYGKNRVTNNRTDNSVLVVHFVDCARIMNVQQIDYVVAERLGHVGKALDVREQNRKLSLRAFKPYVMVFVSMLNNVPRRKASENRHKIVNRRRKRVK